MSDFINPIKQPLFDFLNELKSNNNRDWFADNKHRYISDVRDPLLEFIYHFGEPLGQISPHFIADSRPNGGSLFRIYRDVRFSKNKEPYKTNAGVHFRHIDGKNVHAPGFYLHLEPGSCFAGCGVWRPDGVALKQIRDEIVDNSKNWTDIISEKNFQNTFDFHGEKLKRPPKGYDSEHPQIEDLKRKSFIVLSNLKEDQITSPAFPVIFTEILKSSSPFVSFLTRAVGVPF
ncbi:MAG: TIGR02453 family protein [Rhodobacteraceae bacterium]|nr:TIGR02453 family protein [Paracoccaceae bacterium]